MNKTEYDWRTKYEDVNVDEYGHKTDIVSAEISADNNNSEQDSILFQFPEEVRKTITPAKLRAATMYLTGSYTYRQIGEIIGVTGNTISTWLRDENLLKIIDKLQEQELKLAQVHLNSLRENAINTMNDLLNSNMDNVRFSAAKDILDRSGLKATQNIKIDKKVTTLEQQMADLADFTISEDDVIDVDFDDIVKDVKNDEDWIKPDEVD